MGRIIGALVLLLIEPLSAPFFTVYILCCVSDILDGYVARKTKTTSKLGEALDSIADFIFIAIVLFIFIPLIVWEHWMIYWIGAVAFVRFVSLVIGYAKYHTLAFLHTYANKITGVACACFPVLLQMLGLPITVAVLCFIASLSAFEELVITISSKQLLRNEKGLLFSRRIRKL